VSLSAFNALASQIDSFLASLIICKDFADSRVHINESNHSHFKADDNHFLLIFIFVVELNCEIIFVINNRINIW